MDVDWITVAAQIVNFLVLVWLLQRFLYGPIIRIMDERDLRIAGKLQDAQQKAEQAEAEVNRYHAMQDAMEKRREERLVEVREEAEGLRKSLQSASREEVTIQRSAWLRNLSEEKAGFLEDIQERAAEAFMAMARRALSDLANEQLEDQISRRFLTALGDLEERDLKRIQAACERVGRTAVVRTTFDLTTKRRKEIKVALGDVIGAELNISFERTSDLVCGVELRVGGQLVRWSLDSFLDELETELRDAVERRAPESGRDAVEQAEN